MSPAGYWPQAHAAIEAGADAIYFGLTHFTARAKVGFTLDELPDLMRTLHQRGVRGYLTFNTLVFDHELREAARTIAAIAAAGVDALIVQDVGIAQLAHQISPDLEVHGSTQMSITSAEGVELARRFGVNRVVLGRELSLADIRAIRSQTDIELEMFVHGALCVSYSGQCFSSEAWGGRSANRGQCAQACRLPYELIVDQQLRPLGDARYLLSPGDLYALHQIPEIVAIGVSALKIEGRYKDSDYVALTTRAYRKAVDDAWAGLPLSITPQEELQLEQVYSRGLGPSFVSGTNHQTVVRGRSPRHRGVLVGEVVRVLNNAVLLAPALTTTIAPLKPGDGLVFDAADWRSPEEHEEGGRIYEVIPMRNGQLELRFGNGAIEWSRIRAGDLVWRSHDPELDKMVRPYTEAKAPVQRQPLRVRAKAHVGQPLLLEWELINHQRGPLSVQVRSPEALVAAQNRALTSDFVRDQLGRLGGSAYILTEVELDLAGQPFIPSSLLNAMRREAVEQLSALQSRPPTRMIADPIATLDHALAQITPSAVADIQPALHLLVRTPDQLAAAIALRPASITLDYLELYGLKPAVEQVQAAGIEARVASPRILKPSEQRIVRFLLKLDCPILVRSAGLLQALLHEQAPALIGDFSLNAANLLSAQTLLGMGLNRLTPTHDLNAAQITELAQGMGAERIEVIAYQHLPVFHTEHCVFCRFLSKGTSYKDCGHPCEQHRVALRDHQGREHPVMADVGCRNTVFGAEAQESSAHLDAWQAAGIQHYRLEFVHEDGEQVGRVAQAFRSALDRQITSSELGRRLRQIAPQGTTQGSLFVPLIS
ncbi:MAG: U32 family peptidase [Roseiflexaceae bacterium]